MTKIAFNTYDFIKKQLGEIGDILLPVWFTHSMIESFSPNLNLNLRVVLLIISFILSIALKCYTKKKDKQLKESLKAENLKKEKELELKEFKKEIRILKSEYIRLISQGKLDQVLYGLKMMNEIKSSDYKATFRVSERNKIITIEILDINNVIIDTEIIDYKIS